MSQQQLSDRRSADHPDIWPEAWEPYLTQIPEGEERKDLIAAYYKQLTQPDEQKSLQAAKAWATWEESTSKLYQDPAMIALADNDAKWARCVLPSLCSPTDDSAFASIECHYFVNGGFFPEGHLVSEPQLAKM